MPVIRHNRRFEGVDHIFGAPTVRPSDTVKTDRYFKIAVPIQPGNVHHGCIYFWDAKDNQVVGR